MILSTSLPSDVQEGEATERETHIKLKEEPPGHRAWNRVEIGLLENVRMGLRVAWSIRLHGETRWVTNRL